MGRGLLDGFGRGTDQSHVSRRGGGLKPDVVDGFLDQGRSNLNVRCSGPDAARSGGNIPCSVGNAQNSGGNSISLWVTLNAPLVTPPVPLVTPKTLAVIP